MPRRRNRALFAAATASVGLWTPACLATEIVGDLRSSGTATDGGTDAGTGPGTDGSTGTGAATTTASGTGTGTGPGPDSGTSTDAATGETTSGGLDPTPVEPCGVRLLGAIDGVEVVIVEREPWVGGTCYDVTVRNDSGEDLLWWVRLRFGGELYNRWNAVEEALDETAWEFRGNPESNNVVVLSGQQTEFGACMNCDVGGTTGTDTGAGTGTGSTGP